MKKIIVATNIAVVVFFYSSIASAHVVVTPTEVKPGAFQTFSMVVPVEKNNPTIGLRLIIPTGLQYVTPNVKPGWTITTKKDGDTITEISWTGGSIPAGQRDDFMFSAKVPGTDTILSWKAYQTYKDGTEVAWDHDPKDTSSGEPYSITTVNSSVQSVPIEATQAGNSIATTLSLVAFVISLFALFTAYNLKKASKY